MNNQSISKKDTSKVIVSEEGIERLLGEKSFIFSSFSKLSVRPRKSIRRISLIPNRRGIVVRQKENEKDALCFESFYYRS